MDCERVVTELPPRRPLLVRSLLALIGVLVLAWPAFAGYGFWRDSWAGLLASLGALAVVSIAAGASLVIAAAAQRTGQAIAGILGGMLVRMFVPLAALMAAPGLGAGVLETGVREMLLGYYFVALAVESWLLVRLVPACGAGAAKAA